MAISSGICEWNVADKSKLREKERERKISEIVVRDMCGGFEIIR